MCATHADDDNDNDNDNQNHNYDHDHDVHDAQPHMSQNSIISCIHIKQSSMWAPTMVPISLLLPRGFSRSQYSNEQSSFAKL